DMSRENAHSWNQGATSGHQMHDEQDDSDDEQYPGYLRRDGSNAIRAQSAGDKPENEKNERNTASSPPRPRQGAYSTDTSARSMPELWLSKPQTAESEGNRSRSDCGASFWATAYGPAWLGHPFVHSLN